MITKEKCFSLLFFLLALASPTLASAEPLFASWTDANSGSVDGIGFSVTGLSDPQFGDPVTTLALGDPDWNNVGSQTGRVYNANSVSSFTINFDSAVSDLELYLYFFRGAGSGGGGATSYDFGEPFTVAGGLGGVTVNGTSIDSSTASFVNGVLAFNSAVSALTVTATGEIIGGDQGFTLARNAAPVPEPCSLALLLGGLIGLTRARHWSFAAKRSVR